MACPVALCVVRVCGASGSDRGSAGMGSGNECVSTGAPQVASLEPAKPGSCEESGETVCTSARCVVKVGRGSAEGSDTGENAAAAGDILVGDGEIDGRGGVHR